MTRIFILLAIIIGGLIIGPQFAGHQGYVLIVAGPYTVEMSLTSMIILVILTLAALFILDTVLRRIVRFGSSTQGWFARRKRNRARKQTIAGLLKLTEGDYQQAERLMAKSAEHADQPVVNLLMAAEAAQQRGDNLNCNQYLHRAAELAGSDTLPVDITRVRLQLAQGEIHAARHGVDNLLAVAPRHPQVLRLAQQTYSQAGAYAALLDLLPQLTKSNLFSEDELTQITLEAENGLMSKAMHENGSEGLMGWLRNQPRKRRTNPDTLALLAGHLIECDDHYHAQAVILDGLHKQAHPQLLKTISKLHPSDPAAVEKVLQHLLKKQPNDALINRTLGHIQVAQGEYQQAESSLKKALAAEPVASDYALLANVMDKLGMAQDAGEMRRKGLATLE
ncbi:MAG: heme biosynthesis HemY N-terminal domain-containing protein [Plesiomonas sp.]|uniref:heme biosynthesis HemY N-terminal domain-containing protein n=1 Tax=Plesiomonas sp. TaxID=2486279 RepID=UPI003F2D6C40